MERLKEALNRAKKERGGTGAWSSEMRAAPDVHRRVAPVGVEHIVYTRTRAVPLRPELLGQRHILPDQSAACGDAYRMLSTQVLQRMQAKSSFTLAITSPRPGEGKTLTAINLAIAMAMGVDRTVLLVDADLREPGVQRMLDIPDGPGLSDYLVADTPLDEILVHPEIERLVVLPAGRPLANSSEMLASRKMRDLVQELRVRYASRYILFDLPPVLNAADALAFSPLVDALLLVVEDAKTRRDDVARAAQLLGSERLMGFVLNKVKDADLERSYG